MHGILFAFIAILILILFRNKFIKEKSFNMTKVVKIIVGIFIPIIFVNMGLYNDYSLWDMQETYRFLGSPITVVRMLEDINVEPPEGYNKDVTKNILDSYKTSNKNNNIGDTPNIIVIINESFCNLYDTYQVGNLDPTEYFTSLSKGENAISGIVYSSEYGGRTANVEYEFLTQNSTKILPEGSYVFQQYLSKPINSSIVKYLKSIGYKTSAIHPWAHYAYSRSKIYDLFGFDSTKFINDIEGIEENFNNSFPSDKSTYVELIKEIKNKKKDEKIFEYVLTVQNHIAFTNPDPKQKTYFDDNEANVFMQLTHSSSEALRDVIDVIKDSDEKYVLLFFGDHQPNIAYINNLEKDITKQYEVPFLIWANYDIEEEYNIKTSMVYLQNYLFKAAGIDFTDMNNFMANLQKQFPVLTKKFFMDSNYNIYEKYDDNNSQALHEYNDIVYYRIFDDV